MNNNLLRNPESDDHETVLLVKCEELLEDACLYGDLYDTLKEKKALGEETVTLEEQMKIVVDKYEKKGQPSRPSVLPHPSLESQFLRLTANMRCLVWSYGEMSRITERYGLIRNILSITVGSSLPDTILEDLCNKVVERWTMRKHILLDEKISFTTQKLLGGSKRLEIFEEWILDEATGVKEIFKRKLKKFFQEMSELCDTSLGGLSVLHKKTILRNMGECISVMEMLEKHMHTLTLGTKEEIYTTLCSNPDDPDQLEYRQDLAKHIGAKYVGMFREENGWYASYLYGEDKSGIVHVSGKVVPGLRRGAWYYGGKFFGMGEDGMWALFNTDGNRISNHYFSIKINKAATTPFFLGINRNVDNESVDFIDLEGNVRSTVKNLISDGLFSCIEMIGNLVAIKSKMFFPGVESQIWAWMLYNENGKLLEHPRFPAYELKAIDAFSHEVYEVKKFVRFSGGQDTRPSSVKLLAKDAKTYVYWNKQLRSIGEVVFLKTSKVEVQYPWIYGSITSERENLVDGIMIRFHNMLSGETIETDHIANISPEFLTSGVQTSKGTFQELLLYTYGSRDKEITMPQYAVGIETRGSQYGDTSATNSVVTVKKFPEEENELLWLLLTYESIRYRLCVQVEDGFFQKKFHPILELLPHEIRDQVGEFIKNHRLHTNLYHRAAIEEIWIEPELEAVLFLRGGNLYMYMQGKEELLHELSTFYLASHSRPFRKGNDGSWRTLMDRPVISHPKEYFLTLSLDAPAGKRVHTGSLNRVIQAGEGLFWVVHYDKTEQPTGSVALYDECYQYLMTMGELEATEICDVSGELPQFRDGVVKFGKKGEEYYLSKKGRRVFW